MKAALTLCLLSFCTPLICMRSEQIARKKNLPIVPTIKIDNKDCYFQHDAAKNLLYITLASLYDYEQQFTYDLQQHHLLRTLTEIEPQGIVSLPGGPLAVFLAKRYQTRDSVALMQFLSNKQPARIAGVTGLDYAPGKQVFIKQVTLDELPDKTLRATLIVRLDRQKAKMRFLVSEDIKNLGDVKTVNFYHPFVPALLTVAPAPRQPAKSEELDL